jgi:hypothetical protein
VFADAPSAFDDVGQDWRQWITNGIVDFLCPMDYTTVLSQFTNFVSQQLAYGARVVSPRPHVDGEFIADGADGADTADTGYYHWSSNSSTS